MYDNWKELEESIINCKNCKLCTNRRNIVLGEGNKNAQIMFIGDGPRTEEDIQGKPFVGKDGQLMDRAFEGIGLDKNKIYITNLIKCRIPNNKILEKEEITECLNYLRNEVILIKPKIIVLLGNVVLKNILNKDLEMFSARGNWIEKKGIWYLPTWHPSDLLKDEKKKIQFWNDLKNVIEKAKENENFD